MLRSALVIGALAACTPTAQQAEVLSSRDDQTCSGYGFQAGSEGYAACRMQLAQGREAVRQQQVMAASAAMQRIGDGYYAAAAANPTVTLNCLGC